MSNKILKMINRVVPYVLLVLVVLCTVHVQLCAAADGDVYFKTDYSKFSDYVFFTSQAVLERTLVHLCYLIPLVICEYDVFRSVRSFVKPELRKRSLLILNVTSLLLSVVYLLATVGIYVRAYETGRPTEWFNVFTYFWAGLYLVNRTVYVHLF